jgi:hypothetical protein
MSNTPLPRRYQGLPGFDTSDDTPVPPSLLDNFELIQDLCRYAEGLFTRDQVKKKWRKLITEQMWETLGGDDELVDRIEAEKVRRVRDGSFKRERAQQHITKGPDILESIMSDPKQSAKHRIDSAKALDQFAGNPSEAEQQDRIVIRIDMGADVRAKGGTPSPADVLVFETSPRPNPIDVTPQEQLPPPRRGPGRPPGSKNKPKELQQRNDSDG